MGGWEEQIAPSTWRVGDVCVPERVARVRVLACGCLRVTPEARQVGRDGVTSGHSIVPMAQTSFLKPGFRAWCLENQCPGTQEDWKREPFPCSGESRLLLSEVLGKPAGRKHACAHRQQHICERRRQKPRVSQGNFHREHCSPGRACLTSSWHTGVPGSPVWEALDGAGSDRSGEPLLALGRRAWCPWLSRRGVLGFEWCCRPIGGGPSASGLGTGGPISGHADGSVRWRSQGGHLSTAAWLCRWEPPNPKPPPCGGPIKMRLQSQGQVGG